MNGSDELHAFVDGEMDREAAGRFAAKVAAQPILARQVARLRADKAALARTYGAVADQPIPERLLAPLRRRRRTDRRLQIASGLGLAAALALMLWLAPSGGDRLVREALRARDGSLAAARVVAATDLAGAEQRDQLVTAALHLPIKVPDLEASGYHFAAIALYEKAAQISYRDQAGRAFTLYLRPPLGPDRFDMQARGPVEVCVWENADMAVAMVGEMSAKDMLKLAAATYADLNL